MSGINEILRDNIIAKLKEYNAYIDNELPDYITVMLANNKTISQINQDLQLFLGDNTNRFTAWLQSVMANPDLLKKGEGEEEKRGGGGGEREEAPTLAPVQKRKRVRNEDSDQDVPHPLTSIEEEQEEEENEEEDLPFLKVTKMRSDRYEREDARRSGHRDRPSNRHSEGQRTKMMIKKHLRGQPASTRDRDLRELIDDMKHSDARHPQQSRRSDRIRRGESEEEEEKEEEGEVVEDVDIKPVTVASVVQLVERPQRTDEGGSRLLRRAILGLGPLSKRGKVHMEGVSVGGRARGREKVILLPVSVLNDDRSSTKNIVLGKKKTQKSVGASKRKLLSSARPSLHSQDDDDEDDDDDDDEDEVIVEIGGVEKREYEDEYNTGELEEDDYDSVVTSGLDVPQGKRIRVAPSSSVVRERLGEEDKVDLRDIINKSREGKIEKRNPRFIVTLSGVNDKEEKDAVATLTSPDEEISRKNVKERLGTKLVDVEGRKEEIEETSAELPERCRFWPNCKNGDSCPYHHPTVPCNLFPDCKYGKKCLFVHPQCKFNSRCTRADCRYLHTAPRHLANKSPMMPQVIPTPMTMPVPQIFRPMFNPSFSFGSSPRPRSSPRSSRFPNKSALSWKPPPH